MTAVLKAHVELCETDSTRIVVSATYHVKEHIQAVPGARWDSKEKIWTVPRSWVSCLALRSEFGDGLTIGPELNAWAAREGATKAKLRELRVSVDSDEARAALPDKPGFKGLFGHQQVDALSIGIARRFLLLNETGTGKSRSALAGLSQIEQLHGDVFPLLIVAPKSMRITWGREVEGFFPGADVRICQGTPSVLRTLLEPGGDVYVVSWDAVRQYSRLAPYGSTALSDDEKLNKELQAIPFKSAIIDEIHRGKNGESKRTRAVWAATASCENVIGLTGTPVQDTIEDLWAVLRVVSPHEYPTKTRFLERFADLQWNVWGGRDINGLNEKNREEFFNNFDALTRRVTKDMALDLPDKVYQVRWVDLPPKLRKAYEGMQESLAAELDTSVLASENLLERAGRLLQLANSWGEVDSDGQFHMQLPSPKIEAFITDVLDGDYDGQQVVVFTDSRQLADLLMEQMTKKKLTYVAITGSVTGDDRQRAVDTFQEGHAQFCVVTRAGGEGVTLTAASTMVRLVRPWSHTTHRQAEDRVHRIGSEIHDQITYVDYISDNTIECAQLVKLNAKEERSQEILRDRSLLEMIKSTQDGTARVSVTERSIND